jgi:hypothetical protein
MRHLVHTVGIGTSIQFREMPLPWNFSLLAEPVYMSCLAFNMSTTSTLLLFQGAEARLGLPNFSVP